MGYIKKLIYFLVNQEIFGHVAGAQGRSPVYSSVMCNQGIYSIIFIGYT
jgi:hypothetical protein